MVYMLDISWKREKRFWINNQLLFVWYGKIDGKKIIVEEISIFKEQQPND